MIQVAIIVKNEESVIKKCLESVKGLGEIIVCDTGSTDKTIEIAKKYGKVYTDYKWEDSFAKARNYVLSKCKKGEWILSIDADEELLTPHKDVLKQLNGDAVDVDMVGNTNFKFPRIFKNDGIRWEGSAHNHLAGIKEKVSSDIKIRYGNSPAHKLDPDRTLRILEKAVKTSGPREKFYLAREYSYKKKWIDCLYWCDKYLKDAYWGPEKAECCFLKARALWYLNRGEEARDSLLQAIKINTNFKEAIEFMGEISGPINKKRWKEFAKDADNSNVLFVRKKEKDQYYYDQLLKVQKDFSRYDEIHKKVGELVGDKKVLDIGCGRADVAKYIKNYSGFDFSKEAIKIAGDKCWVGNAYDQKNYKEADIYICLETLEHLEDEKVFKNVKGRLIFSVPNFDDTSHIRTYNKEDIEKIGAKIIATYGWDKKWKEGVDSGNKIYLCEKNNNKA